MRLRSYNKNKALILVLNADYLPINVTTFKKAFKLVFKGKAEVVENGNDEIITYRKNYNRPSIIRLVKYVVIPHRKVVLSRENIFKRDGNKCVYCSSEKNLTLDHIIPRSKGGDNSWKNLVTCCYPCNSKKGDKSLEQSGLKLINKPFKPTPIYFMCQTHRNEEKWQPYLMF